MHDNQRRHTTWRISGLDKSTQKYRLGRLEWKLLCMLGGFAKSKDHLEDFFLTSRRASWLRYLSQTPKGSKKAILENRMKKKTQKQMA